MAKFHVKVPELWIQTVEVEADTQTAAIRKVLDNGEGEYLDNALEYSNTLNEWKYWDALKVEE